MIFVDENNACKIHFFSKEVKADSVQNLLLQTSPTVNVDLKRAKISSHTFGHFGLFVMMAIGSYLKYWKN